MGLLPSWTAIPGALAARAGVPAMGVLPSWTAIPGALAARAVAPRIAGAPRAGTAVGIPMRHREPKTREGEAAEGPRNIGRATKC